MVGWPFRLGFRSGEAQPGWLGFSVYQDRLGHPAPQEGVRLLVTLAFVGLPCVTCLPTQRKLRVFGPPFVFASIGRYCSDRTFFLLAVSAVGGVLFCPANPPGGGPITVVVVQIGLDHKGGHREWPTWRRPIDCSPLRGRPGVRQAGKRVVSSPQGVF